MADLETRAQAEDRSALTVERAHWFTDDNPGEPLVDDVVGPEWNGLAYSFPVTGEEEL